MQAIEIETRIGEDGQIALPARYRDAFGKTARLVVLLPESSEAPANWGKPGSATDINEAPEDGNPLKDSILFETDLVSPMDQPWDAER